MPLNDEIDALKRELTGKLAGAADATAVKGLGADALGRKGRVRELFARLGALPAEERGAAGAALNALKPWVEDQVNARLAALGAAPGAVARDRAFDVSLPGRAPARGRYHLIYETQQAICEAFARLGFSTAYGPEIETPYYNFAALNIPIDHPSADSFDTFYTAEKTHLLRSHTSPVQVHVMEGQKPPIRVVVPGKVFRPDDVDARHMNMFFQVEGLLVDEDVSFADLKGVLHIFARQFFGDDVRMRFRPSFFPFTEPSAEVDISCIFCGGKGCNVCGTSGWLEILGSGMVHPKVLAGVGIDPEVYTGFAFGMGVERVAMLQHRVNDIRLFTENHYRFLRQF
ncbi:MAG: phenylalanine--tRNA ligase subunit alpha [Planctomycetes bacterium]|nr:phenylalanine--tRNA ligase subunit alpha [Planctomycetota bacterium]